MIIIHRPSKNVENLVTAGYLATKLLRVIVQSAVADAKNGIVGSVIRSHYKNCNLRDNVSWNLNLVHFSVTCSVVN
jgi:hypothetical protein